MPGVPRSTRIIDCWRYGGASKSVLPMTMKMRQRSRMAPEVHHFLPLRTYSSPSRSIDSCTLVASELATSGSVMPNALRISPSSRGRSQRSFWSSVPKSVSTSMLPVSGALQLQASEAMCERPMISASGAYSTFFSPGPCCVSGWNMFHSPRERASSLSSSMIGGSACGSPPATSCSCHTRSAGYTASSMNASRRSRKSLHRSVSSKSMPEVYQSDGVDEVGDGLDHARGHEREAVDHAARRHAREHEDRLQPRLEPRHDVGVHAVAD